MTSPVVSLIASKICFDLIGDVMAIPSAMASSFITGVAVLSLFSNALDYGH